MNKKTFLKKLKYELRKLKKDERNKYIEYYDEIISDIVERGVSEKKAIAKQGDVVKIAQDILANANPSALRNRDWRGIALVTSSLILLLSSIVPFILKNLFKISMNTTIGVIGGADGPTSTFVAGKIGTPWGVYFATVVVVVTMIVYFIKKRRK